MAEAQEQEDPSLTLARLSIRGSTTTTTTHRDTDTHTDTDTDATTNKPLRTLFHDAHHLYTQLDNGDATDTHTHTQALTLLHELQRRVASLGLLSTNEEDEKDIPTADLKYILLDFYLGTLATHTPTDTGTDTHTHTPPPPPPQARLAAVEKARRYFLSFMSKCERLGLLKGEEEKKAWAAEKKTEEEDNEDQEEEEEDDSGNDHRRRALLPTRSRVISGASNISAEAQRSYKIARFRKEKEMKSRLRELDYMYEKLSKEERGGKREEEEDDDEEDMYDGQLEEIERERTKLWVSAAVGKVLDEWPMLRQEKQILTMMCKNPPPTDTRTHTHGTEGREDGRRRPAAAAKPLQVTHIDTVAGPGSQLRIRQEELRAGM